MTSFKQDFIQSVKIIILALFIAVGTSYIFAWTAPTSTPPNGDVSAPLNVGSDGQTKVGGLILGTGISATGNGLIVTNGKVGIGTIAPTQKLDVTGQIHSTGDICTDAGGGKCLSTVESGAYVYWTSNEWATTSCSIRCGGISSDGVYSKCISSIVSETSQTLNCNWTNSAYHSVCVCLK